MQKMLTSAGEWRMATTAGCSWMVAWHVQARYRVPAAPGTRTPVHASCAPNGCNKAIIQVRGKSTPESSHRSPELPRSTILIISIIFPHTCCLPWLFSFASNVDRSAWLFTQTLSTTKPEFQFALHTPSPAHDATPPGAVIPTSSPGHL